MNEIFEDINTSEFREEMRNKLTLPFVGEGIHDGAPPNWYELLKYYSKNYRTKMAQALLSRVGHDGD